MPRGQSMRQGETVLRAGHVLRGIEASLLAEVGRSAAWVFPRPRVAILSTGNELVPADAVPAAGQIRNSNGPLLLSLARDAGGMPVDLGIAVDTEADLRRCVAYGLRHEVLILSGGVSAGALDLVPHVLAQEGVQKIFHKVKLKPGKPLWFGTYPCGDERETLVFGLPGNPVSSLVCFELFVRPALHQILRQPPPLTPLRRAVLRDSFQHHGDRPTYYPARLNLAPPSSAATSDLPTVELLNWRGSADLRTLADAHCLVCFPAGEAAYSPGSQVAIQGLMRMN
jgi:molybdopterin molybdotransferase